MGNISGFDIVLSALAFEQEILHHEIFQVSTNKSIEITAMSVWIMKAGSNVSGRITGTKVVLV